MEQTFLIIGFVVIVAAIITIFKTYSWLQGETFKKWRLAEGWMNMVTAPVIHRQEWRAKDYKTDITILDLSHARDSEFLNHYYVGLDPKEIIIQDSAHLDYIVQKHALAITKQMIRDGCILITNEPDIHSGHPLRRLVQLHFKIYKPEF